MGIIYLKHINNKINKNIKENKYGNYLNDLIELMIKNKCDITHTKQETILNCKKNNKIHDLKIIKDKNKIKYYYEKEDYNEIGSYYKIDNKNIIKITKIKKDNNKTQKLTELILFEDNKEILKKIEQETIKTKIEQGKIKEQNKDEKSKTLIRTKNNNIIKIENNNDKINYYIGKSYYKEGIYIKDQISYYKINEQEFIEYIKNNIDDIDLLKKHIKIKKISTLH